MWSFMLLVATGTPLVRGTACKVGGLATFVSLPLLAAHLTPPHAHPISDRNNIMPSMQLSATFTSPCSLSDLAPCNRAPPHHVLPYPATPMLLTSRCRS